MVIPARGAQRRQPERPMWPGLAAVVVSIVHCRKGPYWRPADPRRKEDEDEAARTKKKRKPWRYRWPDDLRDEVLARLLSLNAERAAEEKRLGARPSCARDAAPEGPAKAAKARAPRKRGKAGGEGQGGLFG